VSEGRQEFGKFSKKDVILVSSGKNQISTLLATPKKNVWKNPLVPPWKKSLRRPCTKTCKITPFFCKKCVVLHHLATLFNNTNEVSKP